MRRNRREPLSMVRTCFDECFDRIDEAFPDFGACELHEDEAAADDNGAGSERQFAYCMDGDPMIIAFAPKSRDLSKANLHGLMRHEFGHALEYRYGVAELEKRLGKLPETVERRADVIAERVWGDPIVYDHRLVQCVGKDGVHPRPKHLPDKKEKLKPNGKPQTITAYHGARKPMGKPTEFQTPRVFDWGPGFYLSTSATDSIGYGSHLYEATVELSNPIVIDARDPDPALFAWLKKALRIEDESLQDYNNKLGGIFDLYKLLVELGEYPPWALAKALRKKGYDGVIVRQEAIAQHQPTIRAEGDYVVLWDAAQILDWQEVSHEVTRQAYQSRGASR